MKLHLPEEELATAADRVQTQAARVQKKAEAFFRPKTVALLFFSVIFLLAVVSLIVIIKEKKPASTEEDTTAVLAEDAQPQMESVNFLLAFMDDTVDKIRMLAVLHADRPTGSFSVRYFAPDVRSEVNNLNDTMQAHYRQGGASELLWATGEYLGETVERYILFDDDDLLAVTKLLGEHTVMVEENIRSNQNGVDYIIEKGPQTMRADALCKYFIGRSESVYTGGEAQMTQVLSLFASWLLLEKTETDPGQRLTSFFSCTSSNVSAMDISAYAADLPAYRDGKDTIEITLESVS